MGTGSWSTKDFTNYVSCSRGVDLDTYTKSAYSVQEVYKAKRLDSRLNPLNIMRECRDSDEHPNTLPVILALDVTGSMGQAAVKTAQKLNEIMTSLYADSSLPDVEFCVMGIGDLACDSAPIQMSQFESDIRIAEQMDAIYFEGGGGGNSYESYTAAWYMGARHCDLDCWKRGQKGIIITLGDELPNPYLPKTLSYVTGDSLQDGVETKDLMNEVIDKFNIYHLSVNDKSSSYHYNNRNSELDKAWGQLLGENYSVVTLDNLAETITNIIKSNVNNSTPMITVAETSATTNDNGEVVW